MLNLMALLVASLYSTAFATSKQSIVKPNEPFLNVSMSVVQNWPYQTTVPHQNVIIVSQRARKTRLARTARRHSRRMRPCSYTCGRIQVSPYYYHTNNMSNLSKLIDIGTYLLPLPTPVHVPVSSSFSSLIDWKLQYQMCICNEHFQKIYCFLCSLIRKNLCI